MLSFRGLEIPFKFMFLLVNNSKKINWEWNFEESKIFSSGLVLLSFYYLFIYLKFIYLIIHFEHRISSYIKYFQWTGKCISFSYFCV